jgi:uncharacterized protein (TIGR00730 family)
VPVTVAVFGSGADLDGENRLYRDAYALGRLLAESGFTLATGGYAGVMAAASRGAHDAGGRAIGYTLDLFDPEPPNAWVGEERRLESFGERLRELCESSDAYVALGGGVGTITELAYTWSLLLTGAVPERPLVALGEPWPSFFSHLRAGTYLIRDDYFELVSIVDTPSAAVAALETHFGTRG